MGDLPKTMPVVMCRAPEDYRLEEYAVPQIEAGEVLLRVQSVGICASDLKCYLGAPMFWGDSPPRGLLPGTNYSRARICGRGRCTR